MLYIGRINQRLENRIGQHVLASTRADNFSRSSRTTQPVHDSTIGQHLLDAPDCSHKYTDDCFIILHRARFAHQLKILEAVYITNRAYTDKKNSLPAY